MNLQDSLEKQTHVLPFHYSGNRGTTGRLLAIWDILRGRSALWFGKKEPWPTFRAQEVHDLIARAKQSAEALSKSQAEIQRYRDTLDVLNAKLPEAERLQKTNPEHSGITYVAYGTGVIARGGSGGSTLVEVTVPLPRPPAGYEWPKPDPLKDLEERVVTLEKKVSK